MSPPTLRSLIVERSAQELRDVCARWGRAAAGGNGDAAWLATRMRDPSAVDERLRTLPKKLRDLLLTFLATPAPAREKGEAGGASQPNAPVTRTESEAALAALQREGLLWPAGQALALPAELAESLERLRKEDEQKLHDVLTLQGWLESRWFRTEPSSAEREAKLAHARKVCKMYLLPASIEARQRHLPAPLARVFETVLGSHGGIAACDEIARDDGERIDLELVKKCLEEQQLGTVQDLPLARFGLQPVRAVVLFHEVVLHCLPAWSERHPVAVEETLEAGIDLATNLSRFLRELASGEVQFTAEGQLYKASQKRISKTLLRLPGTLVDQEQLCAWLYRFCLQRRLVDRRGARALGLTDAAHEFEQLALEEKVRTLLGFALEDRELPGEAFHQVRLRRLVLRFLKRTHALQWHAALYLPFLARSAYLAMLDATNAREFFAARFATGGYTPTESTAQLGWNLLSFVKRRLFPLGLVDLGLASGRPVAVRLSKLGAEILQAEDGAKAAVTERASVIVNPDFEILLFPGDDLHDALHALDRYARRTKSDRVHHFVLTKESVRAALAEGMTIEQIAHDLTDRAKVPVPQNVIYTLRDWA